MDQHPNSRKDSLPACNPPLQSRSGERGGSLGKRTQSMRGCGTGVFFCVGGTISHVLFELESCVLPGPLGPCITYTDAQKWHLDFYPGYTASLHGVL